jgi:prepilin-type N-terminal cleavage/methylation domain-containing protein/prepilin-type processing-associated H-X9-DG protein
MSKQKLISQRAFTLVELLVVIAIIGVLVALLLPAVQAAREAARRAECTNKLKQVALSVQNFVSAKNVLPTGGGGWNPRIEDYSVGGRPMGPEKQGLGWGFQILPYLEQGSVQNISTTAELKATVMPGYVCPSRGRALKAQDVIVSPLLVFALSDYVGATPCGYTDATQTTRYYPLGVGTSPPADGGEMRKERFFGGTDSGKYIRVVPDREVFLGAITRAPYRRNESTGAFERAVDSLGLVEMQHIEDGTSNTMLVGEKFIRPDLYEASSSSDDRGWTDGWDPDTMRSTCFPPKQDSLSGNTNNALWGASVNVPNFGSAHSGGFNCSFVDGSVHLINYEIDPIVFDRLGDRRDGEVVDFSAL